MFSMAKIENKVSFRKRSSWLNELKQHIMAPSTFKNRKRVYDFTLLFNWINLKNKISFDR